MMVKSGLLGALYSNTREEPGEECVVLAYQEGRGSVERLRC